jgi:sugar O-acyltransferase (sialic acid O-acetyltransferase NeuD family)
MTTVTASTKPIVIFGAGDIAELAWFYFTNDVGRQVAGFTVDAEFLREPEFRGLPVAAFVEVERRFPPATHDMFVAVSYAKINALRAAKCAEAKARGYTLASYISSRATTFPGFVHGENCFVLEDNTLQPFARLGSNVTLWSGNHIGHHAQIHDNVFITSHVVISGGVVVGENSFIGVNATIRDHIAIGRFNVIGAGSLILKDTPDEAVYSQPAAELSTVPSSRLRRL